MFQVDVQYVEQVLVYEEDNIIFIREHDAREENSYMCLTVAVVNACSSLLQ